MLQQEEVKPLFVCPQCSTKNPGVTRYNPQTYTTLEVQDGKYIELDTNVVGDFDVNFTNFICSECGDEIDFPKSLLPAPREPAPCVIDLNDGYDSYGKFVVDRNDLETVKKAVLEAQKAPDYNADDVLAFLEKWGVKAFPYDVEVIEF
jgi:predicted RNA-binding Zn-ribbon protein involved in translation (DUF1610 family)